MIAVVDYGMGNLHSVARALETAGAEVVIARTPEQIRAAGRIVLPGVGAFGECMKNLRASGLVDVLEEEVLTKGKPFLGICVGMQVLAREGREAGASPGLNWMAATVERMQADAAGLKLPHMGWNEVYPVAGSPLFEGLGAAPVFYFAHSYHLVADDPRRVAAVCEYATTFTAAVHFDNVVAIQFHPEKSQQAGLRVLRNFIAWKRSG